jgi:hypothetical protein
MGTWGIRLIDDDYAADIIGEYFDLYNDGKEPSEIRSILEKREARNKVDPDEGHIFWLALAKAQWDVGALDKDVLEKVKQIVESDIDSKSWIARGATEAEVKKRRESIRNFLQELLLPNPKPKKRRKMRLKDSPYDTGDVLVFQFPDGDYGAAVVFDAEKKTRFGQTGVVTLRMKQSTKPTLEEVKNAEVLVTTRQSISGWDDWIQAVYYEMGYKNVRDKLEKIGTLDIDRPAPSSRGYARWENFLSTVQHSINRLGKQRITLENFLRGRYNIKP